MELNYYKKSLILFFIFMICISFLLSPITVLSTNKFNKIQESIANEGYILFAPDRSKETFLINYDKEVVYSWDSDYHPGYSVYLLSSGNLLHTSYLGFHPIFFAMGMAGGFQEIGFNGEVVWNFEYKDIDHLSHHDIEPLPNGNVLMIAWEYKSPTVAEKAGRKPLSIPSSGLWPDHIVEVKKTGPTSGEIVWEWHVWDHLIQDFNPSKDNYGVVKDHPELIDINFGDSSSSDWLHCNAVDYNEEFDQIIISIRNFNEMWVIDHSTTTEEAAGHSGGNSGKGGDILYRWGNPRAYRAGSVNDQKLFGQHAANWIETGCPGEGNILVFNNGVGRPGGAYSSVDEIIPPVDDDGNYYLDQGNSYDPDEPTWVYKSENLYDFFSASRSGAQRLPDGNTLICNAEEGYFFEVTSSGEIVWDYENNYPDPFNNIVFKVIEYDSDYSGITELLQPPESPKIPSGPTIGIIGAEYEYSSKTSDPNENQIFYLFDWGDGTNSGWIGPYESGETCTANHIWYSNNTYKVKVKAKDIFELESGWSNSLNVVIGNIAPELPIISGPTHGRIGVKYDYTFKAIDLNHNKIRYIINWNDGTSYTSDFYSSGTEITLSHNWTEEGKYVISAKAQDSFGLIGPERCLNLTISKSKATNDFLFHWFLASHQILEKIFYHFNLDIMVVLKLISYII